MVDIPDDVIYSKNVLEMLTVANEYCIFLEESDKYEKERILHYFQKICSLLYLKGSLLPDVKVNDESANERFVTEEIWERIYSTLKSKLKSDDEYWYSEAIVKTDIEPVKGSIAENLADIYQDMKDFIWLYQKNSKAAQENAVYECKRLFESHWGFILVRVQKALHYQLFKDKTIEDVMDAF